MISENFLSNTLFLNFPTVYHKDYLGGMRIGVVTDNYVVVYCQGEALWLTRTEFYEKWYSNQADAVRDKLEEYELESNIVKSLYLKG